MEFKEQNIRLSGSESYIPKNGLDAFRIVSGSLFIYIVSEENGIIGRRLLLCEMEKGRIIPALAAKEGRTNYHFLFVAKDEAELLPMRGSVTSILKRNFAKRIDLAAFAEEGFEGSLVEFYKKEALKDDIYIRRGKKLEPDINIASYGIIRRAFMAKEEMPTGSDPVYMALAYACKKENIPLADFEKVLQVCGNKIDIPSVARVSGFPCRVVILEEDWYTSDNGTILGEIDGKTVACVKKGKDYEIFYPESGKTEKLTKDVALSVFPRAYAIGRALPAKSLTKSDILKFCRESLQMSDLIRACVLALFTVLIGMLLPMLNEKIYDDMIPLGQTGQLIQLSLVTASFMVGSLFFGIVKNLSAFRLGSRISYDLGNAVYHRAFFLPESFYRRFESTDLAQRIASVAMLTNSFISTIMGTGLSALFSLVYLFRMFGYSAKLSGLSILMLLIGGGLLFILSLRTLTHEKRIAEQESIASSKLYQFLMGIDKLRMAGAENRAAFEYVHPFAEKQSEEIKKNRFNSAVDALSGIMSGIFSIVLYYAMIKGDAKLSMGAFIGFNTAFGVFSASILQLAESLISLWQEKPSLERLKPLFETAPEDNEDKKFIGELSGNISLEHVSFSYAENSPNIINDLSLNIKPGEYIGIVGPSGCGKSTLLKLILGFETPKTGQISYDGQDLRSLDKRELRKKLGVVLQNGKLIAGTIYENITITAPEATPQEVQDVIEAVGLAEDIAEMPMGLFTMLSESAGTISGGQQQRILIARAIISHPSILIFDEATSALDNATQAAVCESLSSMELTRIVVAHRLSTIKDCDRILVLQGGQIAEEGNFETLMAKGGIFYRLAKRQLT
ncbi:MAG: NHLP bacteriocin export ABC transporter permease/ATPase subunit [Christensenellaceae bacterium]|nr:NHLP bacteriocin export ABC transporter permease/ATPase subunit [Christensenellaceae bacterium]